MSIFKNGDVICTLGDSITAGGLWMAEAYQHIGKHADVRFYNCGTSGSTATLAVDHIYNYCLSKNPYYVTVMFGVNDIDRWALSKAYDKEDSAQIVSAAVKRHAFKMEEIVRRIIEFGAKPILCTAVPYDEYNDVPEENLRCDYLLDECAEIVRALAEKYGCMLVDFRKRLLPYMTTLKPISYDRVHPTPQGYHMMGQIFLNEIGEIDNVDFDTPFTFEPWNQERYNVELILKRIHFIDYDLLYRFSNEDAISIPDKIEKCKSRYDAETNKKGYIALCCDAYINYKSTEDRLENELTRLTIYPRNLK